MERHRPVLLTEVLEWVPRSGVIVDGTVGDGGHLSGILVTAPRATVIGLDRDPVSLRRTRRYLTGKKLDLRLGSFADLLTILSPAELKQLRFVLLDLGFSSAQVADQERGFTFQQAGPLDMRYNQADLSRPTAADLVNRMGQRELTDLLRRYGEERLAAKIARVVCQRRKERPFKTTTDLAAVIADLYPAGRPPRLHPATRTFQALRIAVNDELNELHYFLRRVLPALPADCLVAIISFHSLEDRPVKRAFRALAKPERNVYGEQPPARAALLTCRVVRAGEEEQNDNPRARSAKMRVLRILPPAQSDFSRPATGAGATD